MTWEILGKNGSEIGPLGEELFTVLQKGERLNTETVGLSLGSPPKGGAVMERSVQDPGERLDVYLHTKGLAGLDMRMVAVWEWAFPFQEGDEVVAVHREPTIKVRIRVTKLRGSPPPFLVEVVKDLLGNLPPNEPRTGRG